MCAVPTCYTALQVPYPHGVVAEDIPLAIPICAKPGDAIMFHQVYIYIVLQLNRYCYKQYISVVHGISDKYMFCAQWVLHLAAGVWVRMVSQATFHAGGHNAKSHTRHMMHMIYGAPWLNRIDRLQHTPELLGG